MLRFFRALFGCTHVDTYRERDEAGVLFLVCHRCEARIPAIERSSAERRRMKKQWKPVALPKAQSVNKRVVPMRRAK